MRVREESEGLFSGNGREIVGRLMHRSRPRSQRPYPIVERVQRSRILLVIFPVFPFPLIVLLIGGGE